MARRKAIDHGQASAIMKAILKAVLKVLHAVFLILCLGYLIYAVVMEGEAISQLFLKANVRFILPALLLWPFGVLVSALFASQIINNTGERIQYRKVLSIYLNRIPAKYLPGGVWQTFARAYDLNSLGLEKTRIGILVVYENFWTVMLAALISSIILLLRGSAYIYDELAMLMLAGIFVLIPIAIYFRHKPFVLKVHGYVEITVTGLIFWCIAAGSFIFYLHGFEGVMVDQSLLSFFANYLFAYVIGFISIFTPQGIGVFEFVMTQLTDFSILQTQALILLAGFRIIVLLGDMIAWLLFILINRTGYFQGAEKNNDDMQNL